MYFLSGPPKQWNDALGGVEVQGGRTLDGKPELVTLFPGALAVMRRLLFDESLKGVSVAVASKTTEGPWAHKCLEEIVINKEPLKKLADVVHFREIYYGAKESRHFPALRDSTGFPYSEMVFYDDCIYSDNCAAVARGCPGVVCVKTPDGLTEELFEAGLRAFAEGRRGIVE